MTTSTVPSKQSASDRLYRLMLWCYPADYRREYGPHMAQVFRDLRRDAVQEGGMVGLLGLWLRVLLDFVVTVLEEHRRHRLRSLKAPFVQACGSLLMLAGGLFIAGSVSQLQPGSHYTFHGIYFVSFTAFLVALVAFVPFGLMGFYALVAPRVGLVARLAVSLAAAGIPLGLFASVLLALGGIRTEEAAWHSSLTGVIAHLFGMFVFGLASSGLSHWARWRLLPIAIALIPLAIFLSPNHDDVRGPLYVDFGALILLGLSWVLLGQTVRAESSRQNSATC